MYIYRYVRIYVFCSELLSWLPGCFPPCLSLFCPIPMYIVSSLDDRQLNWEGRSSVIVRAVGCCQHQATRHTSMLFCCTSEFFQCVLGICMGRFLFFLGSFGLYMGSIYPYIYGWCSIQLLDQTPTICSSQLLMSITVGLMNREQHRPRPA